METTLTEAEADSLFTDSRTGEPVLDQPVTHDSFRQFVSLMSGVTQPPGTAILVCRRKPDSKPETFPLAEKFTLGKQPDCDLSVTDKPTVSKLHFVIERVGTGYLLTDRSSNGTFLYPGTRRLPRDEPYPLKDGDLLWVEGLVLAFKAAA